MSFSEAIGAALAAMHAGVGEVVQYTPPNGGMTVDISVVPIGSDTERVIGGSIIASDITVFEILSAVVTPQRGATIRFQNMDRKVKSFKYADPDHLIWEVECFPPEE